MRLIAYNYTQQSECNITASSNNAFYPAGNLKTHSVYKNWRSNGFYKLTSSNNSLTINSVDYALTEGSYNRSELLSLVNEEIEAVGSLGFDEVTFCFTLNLESEYSISGSFLEVLQMESDTTDSLTGNVAIHTEEYVSIDIRTTEEIDSVVLLWSEYLFSDDAVIKFQASNSHDFTTIALEHTFNPDVVNSVASIYLESAISYRYFRIKIIDVNNAYGYVALGKIVLGNSEVIENCDNGFTLSYTDNSKVIQNDFGVEYVDKYPLLKNLTIDFNLIDDAESFQNIYKRVGTTYPVFIVLDETDSIFSKDLYFIYGKFQDQFNLQHLIKTYFNTQLVIREVK